FVQRGLLQNPGVAELLHALDRLEKIGLSIAEVGTYSNECPVGHASPNLHPWPTLHFFPGGLPAAPTSKPPPRWHGHLRGLVAGLLSLNLEFYNFRAIRTMKSLGRHSRRREVRFDRSPMGRCRLPSRMISQHGGPHDHLSGAAGDATAVPI